MTGHLVIRDDGIEIRGNFRKKFFPWRDIAGFWLREGKPFGGPFAGPLFMFAETSDQGWVTVREGVQFRLENISTYEEIGKLNHALELGRKGEPIAPALTSPEGEPEARRGLTTADQLILGLILFGVVVALFGLLVSIIVLLALVLALTLTKDQRR